MLFIEDIYVVIHGILNEKDSFGEIVQYRGCVRIKHKKKKRERKKERRGEKRKEEKKKKKGN